MRPYRSHPGLEVITEEETTDTHSTNSTMLEAPPPPYNLYVPPPPNVDPQAYEDYMLSNIQHGDDMCTDPGCPYNRWLYSQASFPAPRYVMEWEQDRTRRHFDRLEEIILSPSKMAANSSRSSTEAKDESGSNGSYPVVTLPKSIRHDDSQVKSSLCCLSGQKSGADRNRLIAEEGYYQPSRLQHKQTLPPPYSEVTGTELKSLDVESLPPTLSRPSTPSSCSTCPSSKSSCSCCEGSEPTDPTAPHAFTTDPGRGKRAAKGPPKKKRGVAVCVPRCNIVCCASLTFMTFCVIGKYKVF
jgi:hypothetical protein